MKRSAKKILVASLDMFWKKHLSDLLKVFIGPEINYPRANNLVNIEKQKIK